MSEALPGTIPKNVEVNQRNDTSNTTNDPSDTKPAADDEAIIELLRKMTMQPKVPEEEEIPPPLLSSFDLKGVAELIKSGKAKRIICMCGAGISVSAGIPDFRTPGTGLYSQLQKYELPCPEAVFDIGFFQENPKPFHLLAKELFPGCYKPTPTHYFMKLLHDKGLLLHCFTQNIDSLESQAGLPKDAVIAAHGNFDSAHCIQCNKEYPTDFVKGAVFQDKIATCTSCSGLVKPDIVFFGEGLPDRFFKLMLTDFPKCDLLVVMGTSLVVHPFAGLIYQVGPDVPRLLINREEVGLKSGLDRSRLRARSGGFDFDPRTNYRDAKHLGDCDDGVWELCRLLGWEADLKALLDGTAQKKGAAGAGAGAGNKGSKTLSSLLCLGGKKDPKSP
mmetsp:Transcript_29076/g.64217  ORF Transcript_29076/g.64217 Transcript_29076/m.64217 type:complete len:389 (-) Transcript_29076:773-1939(-)|eukprot:CAMPEP_0202907412 /NCGR_PEP_ID=MMETSP1392-20130828/42396_1 /ASSEMBLY_ACC=CAM_ASM_000868 /TAXON_ID=225041 /ORGANISM="Chlamydomonas chlamydogama, Strain SAG 11-48b" /LENGTH=388 /DNA_ID=CAMNT_0049596279 /DNA_START=225 /DNA_END=1391 /DNA_ORIENTATION=-